MKKLSIAIDMDEVIADPLDHFFEIYKRDHNTVLTLDMMQGKEFYELLTTELRDTWRDYINRKGFFRHLKVIADSQEVVKQLSDQYDVYIVSAAMEFRNSLEDKLDWLADHFPFIPWTNIIFCGKKIVNVDIMIDDRTKNFAGFNGRKLLFSSPHNLLIDSYERVNSWQEVADRLLK